MPGYLIDSLLMNIYGHTLLKNVKICSSYNDAYDKKYNLQKIAFNPFRIILYVCRLHVNKFFWHSYLEYQVVIFRKKGMLLLTLIKREF